MVSKEEISKCFKKTNFTIFIESLNSTSTENVSTTHQVPSEPAEQSTAGETSTCLIYKGGQPDNSSTTISPPNSPE